MVPGLLQVRGGGLEGLGWARHTDRTAGSWVLVVRGGRLRLMFVLRTGEVERSSLAGPATVSVVQSAVGRLEHRDKVP